MALESKRVTKKCIPDGLFLSGGLLLVRWVILVNWIAVKALSNVWSVSAACSHHLTAFITHSMIQSRVCFSGRWFRVLLPHIITVSFYHVLLEIDFLDFVFKVWVRINVHDRGCSRFDLRNDSFLDVKKWKGRANWAMQMNLACTRRNSEFPYYVKL